MLCSYFHSTGLNIKFIKWKCKKTDSGECFWTTEPWIDIWLKNDQQIYSWSELKILEFVFEILHNVIMYSLLTRFSTNGNQCATKILSSDSRAKNTNAKHYENHLEQFYYVNGTLITQNTQNKIGPPVI